MRHIPAELRRFVLRRGAGLCEYCRLSQAGQEATFHIDHVKHQWRLAAKRWPRILRSLVSPARYEKVRARLRLNRPRAMMFFYSIHAGTTGPSISLGSERV